MAARRPIAAEDLLRLKLVGDPQLSPDGRRILFTVRVIDAAKNTYWSHLWLVAAEAAAGLPPARQFTHGEVGDATPRWSPDGRQIAFVRTRDKRQQLWLIPSDGGEARPVTELPEGSVGEPVWSPDGARIAFTFRPTHPDFTRQAREAREKTGAATPPRHITRLHYRLDGFGWLDCRQHVWVCDVAAGQTTQLTDGDEDDADVAWSPDGAWLAFFSNRSADPETTPNAVDLWLVATDAPSYPVADLRRLPTPPGQKGQCVWSPDGRWLAYTGFESTEDPWIKKYSRVWVVPADGSAAARCLTAALDRNVGGMTLGDLHPESTARAQWTADSAALLFLAGDRGGVALHRVALDGAAPAALTSHEQVITGFSRAGETVAAVITSPTQPGDIYRLSAAGDGQPTRLTDLHADLLAEVELVAPAAVWFESADGARVQGWLLRPPAAAAAERSPGILSIHGGPHAQYGQVFFHELQWLAALGYVVLYTNPRGSTNLDEGYMRCIQGNWGDKDQADLLAAAEFLASRPEVDAARLAVYGGSYGGYSTNWLIGHTDRFRCAVTDRCLSNFVSWNGETDMPMAPDGYLPGNPWAASEALRAQSPLTFIANCTTPVLIIHSEGDWRCPIGQAQELYHALKRLKRAPVEFVWYPAEASHGLSRNGPPDLRLDRLRRYRDWFARHLQPTAGADDQARPPGPVG